MFGFINCNKPVGFTSRDVVNVIQGQLGGKRVRLGHCGTLDPLADGVLVVGVGSAARLVPYVHETLKTYHASFQLAAESETGDMEFEPTLHNDHPIPAEQDLLRACHKLTGEIQQTPPAYSAIKINGRRAYKMARSGQQVDVPSRTVLIRSLRILSYDYPHLRMEIVCGTGTYIRTLGMDLAKLLGTVAVMSSLTRTRVGTFDLEDAVTIEQIREQPVSSLVVCASRGVTHMPQVIVDEQDETRLTNGICLNVQIETERDEAAAITIDGRLKSILVRKQGAWCPKRVFPSSPN